MTFSILQALPSSFQQCITQELQATRYGAFKLKRDEPIFIVKTGMRLVASRLLAIFLERCYQ
jgi:hypothetical protein